MGNITTEPKEKSPPRLTRKSPELELALADGLDDVEQGRTMSLDEAIKRLEKDLEPSAA